MRSLDVAGRWACACRENGQLRAHCLTHLDRLLGHLRKPVDDVLDGIGAISPSFFVGQKGRCIGPVTERFPYRKSRYDRNDRGAESWQWFGCWLLEGKQISGPVFIWPIGRNNQAYHAVDARMADYASLIRALFASLDYSTLRALYRCRSRYSSIFPISSRDLWSSLKDRVAARFRFGGQPPVHDESAPFKKALPRGPQFRSLNHVRRGAASDLNLLPLRRHCGHGRACWRLDPIANDPLGHEPSRVPSTNRSVLLTSRRRVRSRAACYAGVEREGATGYFFSLAFEPTFRTPFKDRQSSKDLQSSTREGQP